MPKDICYERIPGQGRSAICDASKSATQGGGVCNLVAQAFLKAEKTSDVAIQNGGGCRSDIAQGNFTIADAWNVLPFSNTLVTLEVNLIHHTTLPQTALESISPCAALHGC